MNKKALGHIAVTSLAAIFAGTVMSLIVTIAIGSFVEIAAAQQQPASQDPITIRPIPSDETLGGLDPVGQALVKVKERNALLEDRVARLERLCLLQVRQIDQLQVVVFNLQPGIGRGSPGAVGSKGPGNAADVVRTPADMLPGDPTAKGEGDAKRD